MLLVGGGEINQFYQLYILSIKYMQNHSTYTPLNHLSSKQHKQTSSSLQNNTREESGQRLDYPPVRSVERMQEKNSVKEHR